VVDSLAGVKSLLGHERRFDLVPTTFGLPRQTDILNIRLNVSNGPEVEVAESTIRRHVRERKIALALLHRETFIPQSYDWGGEAQVDWYEAYADICGERELA